MERLSKFLTQCGIASRRKSEEIINDGRVKVNNISILEPYCKILPEIDIVSVDNNIINKNNFNLYIALYKPVKYLSDLNYNDDRDIARSLIKIDAYLFPVGRLDFASEGLMIFTNNVEFANKIMHPKYGIEKEYLVKLKGSLADTDIKNINKGLFIHGSLYRVSRINHYISTLKNNWYRITVNEGKNRMIRKIGDIINHQVLKLKRIRIGNIRLGNMKPGEYRFLEKNEIEEILYIPK
jgi:23S rRNA pseudouridine2605 synthase